jgi:hypothetical protein
LPGFTAIGMTLEYTMSAGAKFEGHRGRATAAAELLKRKREFEAKPPIEARPGQREPRQLLWPLVDLYLF